MGKKKTKALPVEKGCDYNLMQILDHVTLAYPSMEEMRGTNSARLITSKQEVVLSPDQSMLLYLLLGWDFTIGYPADIPSTIAENAPSKIKKKENFNPGDVVLYNEIMSALPWKDSMESLRKLKLALSEALKQAAQTPDLDYILNMKSHGYYLSEEICNYIKKRNVVQPSLKMDYDSESCADDLPYSLASHFIPPDETYQKMCEAAFRDRFIHVLFGRRGLGKTLLAKYFANKHCATHTQEEYRFKTIIRTYYTENLENTISSLPCNIYNQPDAKKRYHDKLKMLKQCKKPTLLIIDNYDSGLELLDSNPPTQEYKDLRDTGCKILITSRQKINGNLLPRTQIVPLPTDQLYKLFYELADWTPYDSFNEEERKKKTMELIEFLQNNTILTCIAAKLCQTTSPEDLKDALQKLCITENQEPIYDITKDDIHLDDQTLLDICRTLFDFSEFKGDKNSRLFLANLALVPPAGMDYETFLTMAFSDDIRPRMRKYRQKLEKQAWICYDPNLRIISLHPLVREMVVLELQNECKNTSTYLRALNKRFQIEFYHSDLDSQLKLALGAYTVYKKLNLTHKDSIFQDFAFLVTDIAGAYNIMKQPKFSQAYGWEAFIMLNSIRDDLIGNLNLPIVTLSDVMEQFDSIHQLPASALDTAKFESLKHCARSLNILGFSLSQNGPKKDLDTAKEILLSSASLVFMLLSHDNKDDSLRMLFSKNLGNLAGLYLQKKDYQRALDFHQKACSIRISVCRNSKTCAILGSNSELELHRRNMVSLANSYKGMATALFYLARVENTCKNLKKSIESHEIAYSIMKENLPSGSLDLISETSRYSGAVAFYLNLEDCPLDDMSKANQLKDIINHQIEVANILAELPKFSDDIKDCLSKLEQLGKCLKKLPDDFKPGSDFLARFRDAQSRLSKVN